jgi:hypothetical protein
MIPKGELMKWNPLSTPVRSREPLWAIAASPFLFLIVGIFVLSEVKRKRYGPDIVWQEWFAWYPVRVRTNFGNQSSIIVWREKIWRRWTPDKTEYEIEKPPEF